MRRRQFLSALAGAGIVGLPKRTRADVLTTLIVPDLPDGAGGTIARVLQAPLEQALGRTVIIDFRPGAGGIVGLAAGAHAAPDGATLALLTPVVTLAPWLSPRMDCTPADFAPLGRFIFSPAVLAVATNAIHRTLADLLEAGVRGTSFAVPMPSDWSPPQMAQALFLDRTHLPATPVALPGPEARCVDALLAGDLDFAFVSLRLAAALANTGRLRLLGVSGGARDPTIPEVPTLAEAGIDVRVGAWQAIAVPAGTPSGVREFLGAAVHDALERSTVRAELERAGFPLAWTGPSEARSAIAAEYRDAGSLFARLGLAVRRDIAALQRER